MRICATLESEIFSVCGEECYRYAGALGRIQVSFYVLVNGEYLPSKDVREFVLLLTVGLMAGVVVVELVLGVVVVVTGRMIGAVVSLSVVVGNATSA